MLDEDQSAIIARSAELAARRTPVMSGRRGSGNRGSGARGCSVGGVGADRDLDVPSSALEVASVTVIPAGVEPTGEQEPAEGTAADWLPGIRDEHEDPVGSQSRWLDRPTWDRTVTPNIRKRQGTRPPRRRR